MPTAFPDDWIDIAPDGERTAEALGPGVAGCALRLLQARRMLRSGPRVELPVGESQVLEAEGAPE